MTEADGYNLSRLADAMSLSNIKGITFIKSNGGSEYAASIRAAINEIDRLKAERDALQWVACVAAVTLDFMTNRDCSRPDCIETLRAATEFRRVGGNPSPSVIAAVRKAAGLED